MSDNNLFASTATEHNDTDKHDETDIGTPTEHTETATEPTDTEADDDANFELSFYPMTAELARKFKERKITASARCAYDFIALNAASVRNGVSRPVNLNALCEYLNLSKRRVYVLLAELEANELIVPKYRRSRWMFDIPDLSNHTENMKQRNAQKKAKYLERKIELIAIVLKQNSDFSTRQRNGFIKLFRDEMSFDEEVRRISMLIGRPFSTEEQERLIAEFEKLEAKM